MTRPNMAKIATMTRKYSCGLKRIERGRSLSFRRRIGG